MQLLYGCCAVALYMHNALHLGGHSQVSSTRLKPNRVQHNHRHCLGPARHTSLAQTDARVPARHSPAFISMGSDRSPERTSGPLVSSMMARLPRSRRLYSRTRSTHRLVALVIAVRHVQAHHAHALHVKRRRAHEATAQSAALSGN